jgi:hypothetical protein
MGRGRSAVLSGPTSRGNPAVLSGPMRRTRPAVLSGRMVRGRWLALAGLGLALLAAGCGSATSRTAARDAAGPASPAPLSLQTSIQAAGATWAAVPMGAASGADLFWQLFLLPAGGSQWSLQTPPDIATNGAIVLAAPAMGGNGGTGATTLVAGVRPSLDLSFSPITRTSDLGRSWATQPPQSGLADVPDALAAAPGAPGGTGGTGGSGVRLIALGQDGTVSVTTATGGSWGPLFTERALAASQAGRECGLTRLTAVAYSPGGTPLLGGTCGRDGRVGVFRETGGTWQLAGPALTPSAGAPASPGGQRVQVLRLSRAGGQDVALLEVGPAPAVSLLAAWTGDGGAHWTLSPALRTGATAAVSASFGDDGVGVVLAGNRAETIPGPGAAWRRLPALPAGRTVTLALPASGPTEALAADAGTLTAWRLAGSPVGWVKTQTIKVPIQYGSSS